MHCTQSLIMESKFLGVSILTLVSSPDSSRRFIFWVQYIPDQGQGQNLEESSMVLSDKYLFICSPTLVGIMNFFRKCWEHPVAIYQKFMALFCIWARSRSSHRLWATQLQVIFLQYIQSYSIPPQGTIFKCYPEKNLISQCHAMHGLKCVALAKAERSSRTYISNDITIFWNMNNRTLHVLQFKTKETLLLAASLFLFILHSCYKNNSGLESESKVRGRTQNLMQ